MTDDRFLVRRKPGGLIRVVDRKLDEVEVYDMEVQKVSLRIPLQTDADAGEDTATNEDENGGHDASAQCYRCGEEGKLDDMEPVFVKLAEDDDGNLLVGPESHCEDCVEEVVE